MGDRKPWTLTDELAELERTDPAVAKAAANYDRTVRRILREAERRRADTGEAAP